VISERGNWKKKILKTKPLWSSLGCGLSRPRLAASA
jgi:hypothetical protein